MAVPLTHVRGPAAGNVARVPAALRGMARTDLGGYRPGMSNIPNEDVKARAELLPEEIAVGSDDPQEQAEVILEESRERTEKPARTGGESEQTSTPEERPC